MFLSDETVALRPLKIEDAEGRYLHWINDQAGDVYTEHAQFPHSVESLKQFIASKDASDDLFLGIELIDDGSHVGNISISSIDWVHRCASFSILVAPEAQGKGVGARASTLILRHCFEELNLHRIELGVHEENKPAIALYEKLGFVLEGRKREALLRGGCRSDVLTMSLLRGELTD